MTLLDIPVAACKSTPNWRCRSALISTMMACTKTWIRGTSSSAMMLRNVSQSCGAALITSALVAGSAARVTRLVKSETRTPPPPGLLPPPMPPAPRPPIPPLPSPAGAAAAHHRAARDAAAAERTSANTASSKATASNLLPPSAAEAAGVRRRSRNSSLRHHRCPDPANPCRSSATGCRPRLHRQSILRAPSTISVTSAFLSR